MPMTPHEHAREASDLAVRARLGLGIVEERVYRAPVFRHHIGKVQPLPHYRGSAPIEPIRISAVTPIGIFVARKQIFLALFHGVGLETDMLAETFRELPLAEHGWNIATARARNLSDNLWQISRA